MAILNTPNLQYVSQNSFVPQQQQQNPKPTPTLSLSSISCPCSSSFLSLWTKGILDLPKGFHHYQSPFPIFYFQKGLQSVGGEVEDKMNTSNNTVSTDPNDYSIIKGQAEILMHANNVAFFNKTQVNNRDVSVAVLRTFISKRKEEHQVFAKKKRGVKNPPLQENSCEPLPEEATTTNGDIWGECTEQVEPDQEELLGSLSEEPVKKVKGKGRGELKPQKFLRLSTYGLRALRFACEVEGIGKVVALDIDRDAVEACRRNINFNGSVACEKVESHLTDARVHMLTHAKEYDVVDLDPYGSPSVFLDSAVQSVVDGGMLMCMATDMTVLCGGNGEVCYSMCL